METLTNHQGGREGGQVDLTYIKCNQESYKMWGQLMILKVMRAQDLLSALTLSTYFHVYV